MSRTYRVFVSEEHPAEDEILRLTGEESHHLSKVLRVGVGTQVEAMDGRGKVWRTEVVEVRPRASSLRILDEKRLEQPPVSFELAVALPKGGRMDDIVRQLTELGVSVISPLLTECGEVGKLAERTEAKLEKWGRIAIEASKQSGNPWLPLICAPRTFGQWLEDLPTGGMRLLGSLGSGTVSISSLSHGQASAVAVAIGPEGGFSQVEEELAVEAGFARVRLGPHVLRVETATIAALAVAQEIFGV